MCGLRRDVPKTNQSLRKPTTSLQKRFNLPWAGRTHWAATSSPNLSRIHVAYTESNSCKQRLLFPAVCILRGFQLLMQSFLNLFQKCLREPLELLRERAEIAEGSVKHSGQQHQVSICFLQNIPNYSFLRALNRSEKKNRALIMCRGSVSLIHGKLHTWENQATQCAS